MNRLPKIVLISQYFWPENFKINDLCKKVKKAGYDLVVITGLPNYPRGRFFEGYSLLNIGWDKYEGIDVFRVPLFPRGKNKFCLLMNYLTFCFFASIATLFICRNAKLVWVYQLSPIFAIVPAIISKMVYKTKIIANVLDLWPESFYAVVPNQNKVISELLLKLSNWIYSRCDILLVSSKYSCRLLGNRVTQPALHMPHSEIDYGGRKTEFGRENGFKILFAGNIGYAQSMDTIAQAVLKLRQLKGVKWCFLGDGAEKNALERKFRSEGIENVEFLGWVPTEVAIAHLRDSHIALVTLKDNLVCNSTLPSKVQIFLSTGTPIVVATNGETNDVIGVAGAGLCGPAEDADKLTNNIEIAYNMSEKQLQELGANGYMLFAEQFGADKVFELLESQIRESISE